MDLDLDALPTYAELAVRTDAPARSSWGLFGTDDRIGTLNLCTPERIARAAALVTRGAVFSLNWELTKPDPPLFAGRRPPLHILIEKPRGFDDYYDDFFPQLSSQWDSLMHIKDDVHGHYNAGLDATAPRASIEHWARRGIAGRFLLLDLEALRLAGGAAYDPMTNDAFSAHDLDAAVARQAVTIERGDILLLHFGWIRHYESLDQAGRDRVSEHGHWVGLSAAESTAAWLWDHGIAAVAGDAPALEVFPVADGGFLHQRLLPMLGMPIGELLRLDHLADDCAADGRYSGLLTAAPLNMPGGVGSTANALALK